MSRSPQPPARQGRPIVFVVDDDPSVRDALGSLFRSVGLRVELLGSAAEFLQHKRPDGAAAWCSTSGCRA
jgi:FixJ family two-component response regulator